MPTEAARLTSHTDIWALEIKEEQQMYNFKAYVSRDDRLAPGHRMCAG